MPILRMTKNTKGYRDYRGGGRTSARETANWVVGGAVAKQVLKNISINAYTSAIGDIRVDTPYQQLDFSQIENNIARCPDPQKAAEMIELVSTIKKQGDTIGGVVTCVIQKCPSRVGSSYFQQTPCGLRARDAFDQCCKRF